MRSAPSKPDRSQIEHWRRDHVTAWVIAKLSEQFRTLRPGQLAKDWPDYNLRTGQQQVLDAIDRLCNGDI